MKILMLYVDWLVVVTKTVLFCISSFVSASNKIRQIVDQLDMSNLDPNKEFISLR